MKRLFILIAVFLFSMLDAKAAAPLRGYRAYQTMLRSRLFKPTSSFELADYFSYSPTVALQIADLVGTFKNGTPDSRLDNAEPNSLNLLLLEFAFSQLGNSFSEFCGLSTPENMLFRSSTNDYVTQLMGRLCSVTTNTVEAELENLWLAVMSYDAPEDEYWAFKEFFLPQVTTLQPRDFVRSTVYAILMNPYFLLEN